MHHSADADAVELRANVSFDGLLSTLSFPQSAPPISIRCDSLANKATLHLSISASSASSIARISSTFTAAMVIHNEVISFSAWCFVGKPKLNIKCYNDTLLMQI